jgi:hypothetical protein
MSFISFATVNETKVYVDSPTRLSFLRFIRVSCSSCSSMVLLVCPQVIQDAFPGAPVPFGPALATLAGLPAAGQYWHANWTCGSPLAFGKHALSGFPPNNAPLLVSDVGATPAAFENVLLQHVCPPVLGPNAPVRIGTLDERYSSHNLSPPSAFLVRVTLDLSGQPSTPFYVVLGLPTVALSSEPLTPSLWTDTTANAATAPFPLAPGTPLLGTTTHSATNFATADKFPPLDTWWTDSSTWWSMSGSTAFGLSLTSTSAIPTDFAQSHPALAHLWAANCTAMQLQLAAAGATVGHVISPDPNQPALVLPAMLPLPPHHGLPIGQIFAPDIQLASLKLALSAMGLSTIPPWLDHPIVAAWFALSLTPSAQPPPIPFMSGSVLAPRLPSAMFRATAAALQDTALIFANKMRHACVTRVYPKATTTAWLTYLAKAHPGTFDQALPQLHALPPEDNPYLVVVRPSATSTWAKRYGYVAWGANEAHFPPYFRAYLSSIHLIRTAEKDPPKLPLLTWDEETEARQALADAQATPLKSPDGPSTVRPHKQARFAEPTAAGASTRNDVTPAGSSSNAVDLTRDPSSTGTPLAPQDLFGGPAYGAQPVTPASQWSTSPAVVHASISESKRQPCHTWTFTTCNRTFPEQGCYHLISGLTATTDSNFIGSLVDGTPVSPDRFLFPGLVNLRFRRDFLAQIDPNQAITWLRSQYTEDHRQSTQVDLTPEIQPSFFQRETIDMLRREFLCGHELTPADLLHGSTILIWCRSLPTFHGHLFPGSGPTLQDAKTLLSNIQWFFDLSVTEFSAPAHVPGGWGPTAPQSPFRSSLLHEALRDLTAYFLGRHLPQTWNATPSSRRCHFWIFASLLHQLFALFDRWRKQEDLATPLFPRQQPGVRLAGLSTAIYDRHSQTSSSLLQEVQNWRVEARAIFGGHHQYSVHHRLRQDPPLAFFDSHPQPVGPDYSMQQPPYAAYADYQPPPPPPPPSQYAQPPPIYQHQPPPNYQPKPGPPGPGPHPPPSDRLKSAAVTAGKSLFTYAASATPEQRSIATAVAFMNTVGGKAPVLSTKGVGPYKSDRQICLAYCFQAAPFTGCRGNNGNRPCHRLHLDCSRPDALPAIAVAPLVAWLKLDRVRTIVVPTPAFLETHWWRQHTP